MSAAGIARLETNVPFTAALKFPTGLPVEGQYGPQMMFTLVDGRKLYLEMPVAEKITQLGGQEFVLVKRQVQGTRKVQWVVNKASAFANSREVADHRTIAQGGTDPFGPFKQIPAPTQPFGDTPVKFQRWVADKAVEPPPAPPEPQGLSATPPPASCAMTAALIAAIDSATAAVVYAKQQGLALKPSFEDIRALAATIYINGRGK